MIDPDFFNKTRSAFELFHKQLVENTSDLQRLLREIADLRGDILDSYFTEHRESLEKKFHLIKGGAGFLQLKDLSARAAEGETWFNNDSTSFDSEFLREELTNLAQYLKLSSDEIGEKLKSI